MKIESGKLKTKECILLNLAINNFISRKSILSLKEKQRNLYKALDELKKDGLVKEWKMRYRIDGRARYTSCYSITAQGINYLSSHSDIMEHDAYTQWIEYLPQNIKKLRVSSPGISTEKINKFLEISSVSILAYEMGAAITPTFISDTSFRLNEKVKEHEIWEDDSWLDLDVFESDSDSIEDNNDLILNDYKENHVNALQDIVMNAVSKSSDPKQIINGYYYLNSNSPIRYTNAKAVKQIAYHYGKADKQMMYGRYSGIIESPLKSVIIYSGQKKGMAWNRWILSCEFPTYKSFLNHAAKYPNNYSTNINGYLVVENAKMFADIFLDKKKRRTDREVLGDGLESFIVFPISYAGMQEMKKNLAFNKEEYEKSLYNQAEASGYYKKNNENNKNLFPLLRSENNILIFEGTFIDIVKLNKLRTYIERIGRNNITYEIMCYEWQIDFYKRVVDPDGYEVVS